VLDTSALGVGAAQQLASAQAPDAAPYLYFTTTKGGLARADLSHPASPVESPPTNGTTGALAVTGNGASTVAAVEAGVIWLKEATFASASPLQIVADTRAIEALTIAEGQVFWGDDAGTSWRTLNNQPPGVAVVGNDPGPPTMAFAVGPNQRLLWTTAEGVTVETSAATPGPAVLLVDGGVPGTTCFAAAGKTLLYCQESQGVLVYDFDDSTLSATFHRKLVLDDPEALVTDGQHLYVVNVTGKSKATIVRAKVDGTESIVLTPTVSAGPTIALSGEFVYFLDGSKIMRTAK
jgi:hypothetical protein